MAEEQIKAEGNLIEFLEKHGAEGFLKLFLNNYLYDLVMYYLHSTESTKERDTNFRFYFGVEEKTYPLDEMNRLNADIKVECFRMASVIVSEMKKEEILQKAVRNPKRMSPKLLEPIKNALQGMRKDSGE